MQVKISHLITLLLLLGCIPQQQSKPSIPRCPINETYNVTQKKCITNNLNSTGGSNSGSNSGNNSLPVVGDNQTITAFEDSVVDFTVNKAKDSDGNSLYYTLVSAPQNGTIFNCFDPTTVDSRSCTYVPNENFYGTDSLVYKVDDGIGSSKSNATITFTVGSQEDPSTIKDLDTDSFTSISAYSLFNNEARTFLYKLDEGGGVLEDSENITLTIKTSNKLSVPLDLIKLSYTGSNVNLTGLDSSLFIIPTAIAGGNSQTAKIKLNDTRDASLGTLYFTLGLNERDGNTPFTANNITDNYKGTAAITIEVSDGVSATPTIKTLNLTLLEQNLPPMPPSPLSVTVNEDASVAFTVTPSSDLNVTNSLSYTPVALPSTGTLGQCMGLNGSLTTDLSCVYTPAPNYFGSPQTFTYRTFDGTTYSTTNGVVTIYVTPINDEPTALFVSATATANEGSPATLTYTIDEGGDSYEDGQILYIHVTPSSTTVTPLERIGIYEGSTFRGNAATPTVTISDAATLNLIVNHADATPGTSTLTLSLSDGSLTVYASPVTIGFDGSTNVAPRLISFLGTSSPTDSSLLTPVATAGEGTPITVNFGLDEGGYDEDAEMVNISITSGSPGVVPNNGTSLNINSSNSNSLVSSGEGATDLSTITTNNVVIDPTFGNPNFFGTLKFTMSLTDTNASPLTTTQYFNVKWYEINDPPTINANADVTVSEGTPMSAHALTVDEGGNTFENSQTLTLTIAVTPVAITALYNSNDVINNSTMSLTWGSQPLTYDSSRSNTTQGYWTYTVNDNSQNASNYNVLLNVNPAKDATTHGTPIAIYAIVTDNGTNNGTPAPTPAVDSFTLTINSSNDAPQITPVAATSNYTANLNSGIYGIEYTIDEGGGVYEDHQRLAITDVQSSDTSVIPLANIRFYYGAAATCGTYNNSLIFHSSCYVGNGSSLPIIDIDPASTDAKGSKLFVDILANSTPQYGSSTVSFKISDGDVALDPTASISVTINSRGFDHGGWKDVVAYGSKTNLAGTPTSAPYVKIKWNQPTPINGSTVSAWKVYKTNVGSNLTNFNFNSPAATLSSSTTQYIDTSIGTSDQSTIYWYTVRPVESNGLQVGDNENFDVLRVVVPPANMALVHRWIANQEVCELMGATPSPGANFSCSYIGPGDSNSATKVYDLSYDMLVDMHEYGCAYHMYGSSNPVTVPTAGTIFYNRTDQNCYVSNGSSWTTGTPTYYPTNGHGNATNLPPFVKVTQNMASTLCGQRKYTLSFFPTPTPVATAYTYLLSRKQQIAAGAWSSSLSNAEINSMEIGTSIASTGYCNTTNNQSESGIVFNNLSSPAATDQTLPATDVSAVRTVVTGSTYTKNCQSRYGIQDMVGNVNEWLSDQITCTDNENCDFITDIYGTPYYEYNNGANEYHFSSTVYGGERGVNGNGSSLTNWIFATPTFDAEMIFLPMGLPAHNTYALSTLPIVSTASVVSTLHSDSIVIGADVIATAAATAAPVSGGSYNFATVSGSPPSSAGRYYIHYVPITNSPAADIGFRCKITVP